ncbi:60S ribosomal protein L18a [Durusdinium trenchii]|uniref:60S ribosomal protein L18a n=1 Tax=Durusdinium trenchii TaxID=1381693 RepID=A0ABP0MFD2_9DINO
MKVKHFQVIGRKAPTESDPTPQLYRMQVFAPNRVTAKSRFWYFLHQYKKMKKTTGEILSVNQIHEKNSRLVKNFAITLRYNSRSGTHNMTKEYRDVTLVGAVTQMYEEMAGLHRARKESIQIISTAVIPASECKRSSVTQFHDSKLRFPLPHRRPRVAKDFAKTFMPYRPTTFAG